MTVETEEARLKRLKMRSWRRGTKEMDLILGPYCDAELHKMPQEELDLYEQLLSENDQDLYQWVTGQKPTPDVFQSLMEKISLAANSR